MNDDTPVSFSYTITDNGTTNGAADPTNVAGSATLDITPVNDADDNGGDACGAWAHLVDNGNGTWTYTPASNDDTPAENDPRPRL